MAYLHRECVRFAAENERLRKQIHENGLDVHLAECRANGSEEELIYIRESNARLAAENERLRKAAQAVCLQWDGCSDGKVRQGEIEVLRAAAKERGAK